MILTGLALQNFRTYKSFTLKFEKKVTAIVGPNASGKTSIVESIALLSTGNSLRAGKIEEMIQFEAELARVKGVVLDVDDGGEFTKDADGGVNNIELTHDQVGEDKVAKSTNRSAKTQLSKAQLSKTQPPKTELEIILTRGEVAGRSTQRRIFSVNGVRRRKKDAVGHFHTVVFRPEDMRLIEGSPSRRRNFLDTALAALFPAYEYALRNYEQILKRRNKLLQQVREKEQPKSSLHFWNINLIKHGEVIQKHRRDFLVTFDQVDFPLKFTVEYDQSVISEKRIAQYLDKEILAGYTLVGPHKDDIFVFLKDIRLDTYGSRGQQRLGVLWLKFCELEFLREKSPKVILLLDDILSELDVTSRQIVLSIFDGYQTIITTTDDKIVIEVKKKVGDLQLLTTA
jgi:DNA replication and repair protein RecF